jgi:hypothetical protein
MNENISSAAKAIDVDPIGVHRRLSAVTLALDFFETRS